MKKLFFAVLLLAGSAIVTKAHKEESIRVKVELNAQYDKPVTNGIPVPKSPTIPPNCYLDGHTLYIDDIGGDFTIQLTDETDTMVYSTYVTYGTTSVILPSTLTGNYGLSIIPDDSAYYFYGYVMF